MDIIKALNQGVVPKAETSQGDSLDQSPNRDDPPSEPPPSVWNGFKDLCLMAWKNKGCIMGTVTISERHKYHGFYIYKMPLDKQYKVFKSLIRESFVKYDNRIDKTTKYYCFFELTKRHRLHCHWLAYHEEETVPYPYYERQMIEVLSKLGFDKRGIKIEYAKSFGEASRYIAKDFGKHPFTPLYG